MLPHYAATRYVLPLREGGSLPGTVETDEPRQFVVKFRGAGQGPKRLSRRRSPRSSPASSACRCRMPPLSSGLTVGPKR
jgi:hypothetical protein